MNVYYADKCQELKTHILCDNDFIIINNYLFIC